MKIYLMKTNAYNEIVFESNGMAKITESAPSGRFEGIDLYGENTVEELEKWFADNADDIDYDDIYCEDEHDFKDILNDAEEFSAELILIYAE